MNQKLKSSAGSYIIHSLPSVVGKNVTLCTNNHHFHGQVSQYTGEHVVLNTNGTDVTIKIASINAILPKKF